MKGERKGGPQEGEVTIGERIGRKVEKRESGEENDGGGRRVER